MNKLNEEQVKVRFDKDIKDHVITIIRDDGLYRHLRFSRPNTRTMSFDIITWPGYLAYVGDMGDFVFCRVEDMLTFFRHDRINPSYWSEKLQAPKPDGAMEYSEEMAKEVVAYLIKENLEDENYSTAEELKDITTDEGIDHFYRQLSEIVQDCHECYVKDYTFHFLWCCHALVWGIKQYDAAKKETNKMNRLEELKALLTQAGKWPTEPQTDGTDGFYNCPVCDGDGTVDAEFVKSAHAGCTGVQIYGIGDQMTAMEKLLPLLFTDYLPQLIAVAEAAKVMLNKMDAKKLGERGCSYDPLEISPYELIAVLEPLTKDADK